MTKFAVNDHVRVADNARRLHRDAHYLLADSRYRSALALTVLAVEEIGKIIGEIEPHLSYPHKGKGPHEGKQASASFLTLIAAFARAMNGTLRFSSNGHLVVDREGHARASLDLSSSQAGDGRVDAQVANKQTRKAIRRIFKKGLAECDPSARRDVDILLEVVQPLRKGKYNELKNWAFYEDYGSVRQDDSKILAPVLMKALDLLIIMLGELAPQSSR